MILDVLALVAIVLSSIVAFLRGFIRECLTIVGVVGGLIASFFGAPFLIPAMQGWLGVKPGEKPAQLFDVVPMTIVADVLSYSLIFIVVVIVLSVLAHFLAAGAKAVGLGPVDRTLGVIFGIARAVVLLALLYLPFLLLVSDKERDEWFEGSRTRLYIESTSEWIASFLPKGTEEAVDEKAKETGEKIDETRKRLEGMDALKNTADKAVRALDQTVAPQKNDEGYKADERQNLDQLFENAQPE